MPLSIAYGNRKMIFEKKNLEFLELCTLFCEDFFMPIGHVFMCHCNCNCCCFQMFTQKEKERKEQKNSQMITFEGSVQLDWCLSLSGIWRTIHFAQLKQKHVNEIL